MARAPAGLPAGIRLTDHISLGVIAKTFPLEEVRRVLAETGRASERERDLPAHVVTYYAIALALYPTVSTREVLRCLLEVLRWLWGVEAVRVAGKSGISQARTRLGTKPLHSQSRSSRRGTRGAPPPAAPSAHAARCRHLSPSVGSRHKVRSRHALSYSHISNPALIRSALVEVCHTGLGSLPGHEHRVGSERPTERRTLRVALSSFASCRLA
jgi:hypothetical protein